MKILYGIDNPDLHFERCVLTVGNFDGVHRGHQRIVERALAVAHQEDAPEDAPVVALTFEPHPLSVLKEGEGPQRLTTPEMKLELLRDAGVACAVVASSTHEFLSVPAEQFIRDILVARFHPTNIVEGRSFGFGRGRSGNVQTLSHFGEACGFDVHVVDPVQAILADGSPQRVSSSLVRWLLLEGQASLAGEALGRLYLMRGVVVAGVGRGRSLGFPTANLEVQNQLVPGDGVYAARIQVADRDYLSAVSIGTTPTFDGQIRQIEAHLLDFEGDLYGQTLDVRFVRQLRGQRKFDSPKNLIAQIQADLEQTRQVNT